MPSFQRPAERAFREGPLSLCCSSAPSWCSRARWAEAHPPAWEGPARISRATSPAVDVAAARLVCTTALFLGSALGAGGAAARGVSVRVGAAGEAECRKLNVVRPAAIFIEQAHGAQQVAPACAARAGTRRARFGREIARGLCRAEPPLHAAPAWNGPCKRALTCHRCRPSGTCRHSTAWGCRKGRKRCSTHLWRQERRRRCR